MLSTPMARSYIPTAETVTGLRMVLKHLDSLAIPQIGGSNEDDPKREEAFYVPSEEQRKPRRISAEASCEEQPSQWQGRKMIVVHISKLSGSKRVRVCDNAPMTDSVPEGNNENKTLCENCRTAFLRKKR